MTDPAAHPAATEAIPNTGRPGGAAGPARLLVLATVALGLTIYVIGFFGGLTVLNITPIPALLLGGGLLAAATLLPRSARLLVPAAVAVTVGVLQLLQVEFGSHPVGGGLGATGQIGATDIVVLILAVLQASAVVAAVLLEAGVLTAGAAAGAGPQHVRRVRRGPGGGPVAGYGAPGYGQQGYGPAGPGGPGGRGFGAPGGPGGPTGPAGPGGPAGHGGPGGAGSGPAGPGQPAFGPPGYGPPPGYGVAGAAGGPGRTGYPGAPGNRAPFEPPSQPFPQQPPPPGYRQPGRQGAAESTDPGLAPVSPAESAPGTGDWASSGLESSGSESSGSESAYSWRSEAEHSEGGPSGAGHSDAGQSDTGQSDRAQNASKPTLQDLTPASDSGAPYYQPRTFDRAEPDLPVSWPAGPDAPTGDERSSDTYPADEPTGLGGRDTVTDNDEDTAGPPESSHEPGDRGRSST